MLTASLLLLFQAAAADPLAPAWRGHVQCYGPDVARKACISIGAYAKGVDGVIQNKATVLLAPQPPVVMTTTAPTQVKAGAVCGTIRAAHLETATFEVNGQPAPPEAAAQIRVLIGPSYKPLLDREICTTYVADGEALKAQVTINGERRPELDLTVRWVAPDAGFTVKP